MEMVVCARCETTVTYNAVTEGYYAYCSEHDEDLFEFETKVVVK